ncbi:MAG: hypothetical protein DMD87_23135 [Candidatus Rokuibacteriota bacterium]|nr:MAG: hypothetical protein DMD87_23135 [Candidatus Rokubacteria bacterium]
MDSPAVGSASFENVHELRHRWSRRYTGDQYLKLLRTHSDHRALGEARLARLLSDIAEVIQRTGSEVIRHYETLTLLAKRR